MAQVFRLPRVGDAMTEATIVEWYVAVGDRIEADQPICSLETSKAEVEVPSPHGGVVLHLGGRVGDTLELDEVLIVTGEDGESWSPPDARSAAGAADPARQTRGPAPVRGAGGGAVRAMPSVRKLAAELGVDLAAVRGSGAHGGITADDVRTAAKARAAVDRASLLRQRRDFADVLGSAKIGTGRIHYISHGSGPPLLLIMGWGGRGLDWTRELLERLADGHRCIVYDHRGCGDSDPPQGTISIESMADDALALLDVLGIESANVAGHSMGGMIAQRMALAAPRRVEKLALISTHCGGAKALPPTPEMLALAMEPQLGRDAIRRNVLGMSAPGFDAREPEALEAFLDLVESQPTRFRVMQAQLEAIGADDRHDLLPGIEVPTLVVTGDVDPLVPGGNSETLARRIPEAKLTVIAGCGHMVMLERPDALADALRPFLEA